MARSFKKNSINKYGHNRFYKRYANRRLRRLEHDSVYFIGKSKSYRKHTCSYNIYDCISAIYEGNFDSYIKYSRTISLNSIVFKYFTSEEIRLWYFDIYCKHNRK